MNAYTPDSEKRPAVFLDRDGTLIEDRGTLRDPSQIRFFPETVPALRRLQPDYALFIVTHQAGIAAGEVSASEVAAVNEAVVAHLAEAGIRIEAVYCCPHRREDGCRCVKPKPFFLQEAGRVYGLDLARSYTVGDHPHDAAFADGVGATGLYVRTGHGEKHLDELPDGTIVVPGMREVAEWIDAWRAFEAAAPPDAAARMDAAVRILAQGGVAAFPTETVYGLGADARNPEAVARVFEIKGRPRFDPLIVHIDTRARLAGLVSEIPPRARTLMLHFWPGPLTLVLPRAPGVPDLVAAGLPTLAVRMPRHPVARELIRRADAPLAAPSANPFGRTSPTCAAHVVEGLGRAVDCVLDGGPSPVGVESTIVAADGDRLLLLRPGGVPIEALEQVAGPIERTRNSDGIHPRSPGRLNRHYATLTPLRLLDGGAPPATVPGRIGLLAFRTPRTTAGYEAVEVLSPSGDGREAAARLFAAMRRLDALGLDAIDAEPAPDRGLGLAINDRLRRAAAAGR